MAYQDPAYLPHFNGKVQEIRSMGYDFIGALLEMTDNSARRNCTSSNIDVVTHADKNQLSRISVIDDGKGMSFEELKQAIVFNLLKQRDDGDIGKFHVGLKYAAIVIGDLITILSHQAGGTVSGVYLNIITMMEHDTFTPTSVCENVDEAWARAHSINPSDYAKFIKQSSGTIVSVSALTAMCRRPIDKVKDELLKILPFSYSMLYNDCNMNLFEGDKKLTVIKPYDMFYHDTPENLDEPAYETELQVYRDLAGNRVFEVNKNKRSISKKKGDDTKGSAQKPVYYEFTPYILGKKGPQKNMNPVSSLPDSSMLIASIQLRHVQVNQQTFNSEKQRFSAGSKLIIDRKGVYYIREIRQVCSAHQLGKKMPDRTIMAIERQRCLVTFKSDADDLVGSKYNKQMDGLLALPCAALNDAIHSIYKQVTNPWTAKHPGKKKQEEVDGDDEDEEEADLEAAEAAAEDEADMEAAAEAEPAAKVDVEVVPVPERAPEPEPDQPVVAEVPPPPSKMPKKQPKPPASPASSEEDDGGADEGDDDLSVSSEPPAVIVNEIVEPPPVPVYSESLLDADIVFAENDKPVNTLKNVPQAAFLCAWFAALRSTNLDEYKKYRAVHIQFQDFN